MLRFSIAVGTIALLLQVLLVQTVAAYPEIRSIKSHHRLNLRGAIADVDNNSIDDASESQARQKPPCYESIPCGWAHYTTSSNRFRPIYHYTKNTMCRCQDDQRCVLTDNRLDRKAYIFQCRNSDASRHMYPFPELT